jgi:nucleotide-binding universal stress UspA family protein
MLEKVVVGVDGSDASRAAVQWCATNLQPGTIVLAVCGMSDLLFGVDFMSAAASAQLASMDQALRDHWCQPLRTAGLRCECRLVCGPKAAALREIALLEHPDALVVGKRCHGRAVDAVVGGTARRVIHRPPCPLIVVPIPAQTSPDAATDVPADGTLTDDPGPTAAMLPVSGGAQLWAPCRIVFVARRGDELVLDCLIPQSGSEPRSAPGSSVPTSIHVSLPEEPSTESVEETLRAWADTGRSLEIGCSRHHRLSLVQVTEVESGTTVQLEQAVLPH